MIYIYIFLLNLLFCKICSPLLKSLCHQSASLCIVPVGIVPTSVETETISIFCCQSRVSENPLILNNCWIFRRVAQLVLLSLYRLTDHQFVQLYQPFFVYGTELTNTQQTTPSVVYYTVKARMASFRIDLKSYLTRIGLDSNSPFVPTYSTLALIQISHMKSIPFENLDVVGRNIISTNLSDLEKKLIKSHRGGYCFEQNGFLLEVLREIGFKVKPVLVRVRWNKGNIQTPYTHMGLVITLNNDTESAVNYFVDVAFGGLSSMIPVLLPQKDQTSITQESADFGNSRVVRDDSDMECFTEQWLLKGSWVDLYKFSDREALQCDLDVANWYSCTHPEVGNIWYQ